MLARQQIVGDVDSESPHIEIAGEFDRRLVVQLQLTAVDCVGEFEPNRAPARDG